MRRVLRQAVSVVLEQLGYPLDVPLLGSHDIGEGPVAPVLFDDQLVLRPGQVLILDRVGQHLLDAQGGLAFRSLGAEVCGIREGNQGCSRAQGLPIIFLTAKASESDRITGFELGADDYVVKPFSPRELSLRVEAVLRRSGSGGAKPGATMSWVLGKQVLELDEAAHRASVAGNEINLTVAEWKILSYLATHLGVVVGRERLLGESLDYLVAEGSERTVDTHIKNLRAKLGSAGWIETVRGFGYRFSGTPQ